MFIERSGTNLEALSMHARTKILDIRKGNGSQLNLVLFMLHPQWNYPETDIAQVASVIMFIK